MWHFALKCWESCRIWLGRILDLIYPKDCLFCRRPSGDDGYICLTCLERLSIERNPSCVCCGKESTLESGPDFTCSECLAKRPAFERAFIVARYDYAFRELIHRFKYRKGMWLKEDLARYLVALYLGKLKDACEPIDLVVPVPMQTLKRRSRGYNQAELLAQTFAKILHLPYRAHLLKRIHTGIVSQTRLHRTERLVNARAAYVYRGWRSLKGKNVLLIDDVMTTGATCNACAACLRQAGANKVYVLVLARPLNP